MAKMRTLKFSALLLVALLLQSCSEPVSWHASDITGMMPDLEFTLTGPDSEPVDASSLQGKPVLVFFGFTNCPDVCPTSLAVMGAAIKLLENEANVKGLLISFDPERDTLDRLKSYAPFFHPEITGLTASAPRILEVSTRYGVYYKKVERDGKDYLMDHTSRIYIIDQQGKLAGVVNHSVTPLEVAERVRKLL